MPADEALSMVLRQRAWMETGTIMSAQAARDWYGGERAARNSGEHWPKRGVSWGGERMLLSPHRHRV